MMTDYRGIQQQDTVTGYTMTVAYTPRRGTRITAVVRSSTMLVSEDDNDRDGGMSLSLAMIDRLSSVLARQHNP
jgi:hypothetical protein